MLDSTDTSHWRRVFHPTDLSRGSRPAFVHALRLALALEAELEVAHVGGRTRPTLRRLPGVRETLRGWRERGAESLPSSPLGIRKTAIHGKHPTQPLVEYLEERPAELVVLTTHQRKGWQRVRDGETSIPVARAARKAALLLPEGVPGFVDPDSGALRLRRVLIPVDHRPSPQRSVDRVARFLDRLADDALECTLLHVTAAGESPPEILTPPGRGALRWGYEVRSGEPVASILAAVESLSADLVVLPSAGRSGLFERVQGSTAERILRQTARPVLLLPRTLR